MSGKWRAFWLCTLFAAIMAGVIASPFTKPIQIRVSGAAQHQQAEIRRMLTTVAKTPCLLIDADAVEAGLLALPDIASASFRANVFGRARISIQCREPVAVMGKSLGLDEVGRAFPLGSRKPSNLQISANVEDFNTIITISDASSINQLARVAKKIKESLPKLVGTLEIDDKERIRLRIEDLVVEFGDTSDLDAKVGILSRALKENPQRAQEGGSINLVDPEDPVQVR